MKALVAFLRFPLALVFLAAGVAKFGFDPSAGDIFVRLGMEPAGRWIIGGLEVLTAVLLLVPRSAATGAILGWGVMTGALIAHATDLGVSGRFGVMTLVSLALWCGCALLIFALRGQIESVRRMFACRRGASDDPGREG